MEGKKVRVTEDWLAVYIGAFLVLLSLASLIAAPLRAQSWDVGARGAESLSAATQGKLTFSFEQRVRYERKTLDTFGGDADLRYGLARTRVGLTARPTSWLLISGRVQDSRAPWYGAGASTKLREPLDLYEAYIEILPDAQTGPGLILGRRGFSYGEGRFLATSSWGNAPQGYDQARLYYRLPSARLEVFFLSRVKVRSDGFNRPELGQRAWGTYNTFRNLFGGGQLDVFVIRRDYDPSAGDKVSEKQSINSFGGRLTAPLWDGATYHVEGALQTGGSDSVSHRAGALYTGVKQRWNLGGRDLQATAEYNYASGTDDSRGGTRSRTFDSPYMSVRNKYGHQDLFGWKNMHNIRSQVTLDVGKGFQANVLFDSNWLATPKDALYSGSGSVIARSESGNDGRHVGNEAAVYVTYRYEHFQFGAGYAYLFKGGFLKALLPGSSPSYLYVYHTYSF